MYSRELKYIGQKLTELERELGKSTVTTGDLITPIRQTENQ